MINNKLNFFSGFSRVFLISLFCFSFSNVAFAQNHYQKAWKSLDEANISEAIEHFKKALNDKSTKENALLSLCFLYSQSNRKEEAGECFKQYFKLAKDPYPALYSMWFEEGVVSEVGKKKDFQLALLKALEKSDQNIGKLDAATQYRLGLHYSMSMDQKQAQKHYDEVKSIEDWMMLGPFDNVMNSGYDKDFGVLDNPGKEAKFTSKYGAEISWFDPPLVSADAYTFKGMYFINNNSIIYAQTFVEAPKEEEVFLKFSYSGSLKVWINDSLIYREPERRRTEMDYFRFKCKLNKGYNRILIQLGDYNETFANFMMRFTDLNHKPILFKQSNEVKEYQKKLLLAERQPYFATEFLEKRAQENEDDFLYKVLLVEAYLRSNELNKAEDILIKAFEKTPRNYFVLRSLVLFYDQANDNTNQNKYYELFKKNYPLDINILENEIEENGDKEKIDEVKEQVKTYLSLYPSRYKEISYDLVLASLEEDNQKVLALIDTLYNNFPEDYTALTTKYNIEKSYYSNPQKANEILENYLENNFSDNILRELAKNYLDDGRIDDVIKMIKSKIEMFPYDIDSYKQIVNLLSRQSKYKEAIDVCKTILENRPSDYPTLKDMAVLYKYLDDNETAMSYYKESLRYFPFSFETNEKIRELKGQKKAIDLVDEIDPDKMIEDYENNFTPSVKKSYDIVTESRSFIIFKSKAQGIVHSYILKINDENAIESWQNVSFSASSNMKLYIDEAQTIKKNGNRIDADRSGAEVVFTNLEVGDYIYISYFERQTSGGKSSVYISDNHTLNYYVPAYKVNYNLLVEEGLVIADTILNDKMNPEISQVGGFKKYTWAKVSPEVLKEEQYTIPYSDIAKRLHVALDYSWSDIVQWYSDLSTHQAAPDFTIKNIVRDLFDGKNLSDEEKSKIIYDFVSKNIQYSSVDFRQSSYIPQKASNVYHSRLGDCKDVSTLYVSIAREAGLKANLVLVNTSNNGRNDVILPSLNFNHCIVKVYLDEGEKYLELTDPNLPYGHLYYYHKGAAILEIPTEEISTDIQLSRLDWNPNYNNSVIRNSVVQIDDEYKMDVEKKVIKTGTRAAAACSTYYYSDENDVKDKMKQYASSGFKSTLTLKDVDFEILEPRKDTAKYSYSFVVDNDVLKLGSFRAFKVPFTDILIQMNIFEDGERHYEFDYVYYEIVDQYDETIEINLNENSVIIEMPENVHEEYEGIIYDLTFEKLSDQKMKIHRVYTVNRRNIAPEEFPAFKDFMTKVNEAENTHVLFK